MVNLFWLSPPRFVRGRGLNYSWCARQHIDAHIIKIPLEAAQLLYAAHHALPAADDWRTRAPMAGTGERGYRPTHMNNPLSKWLRESAAHYRHAVAYGLALCEEYSHRYGREHACEAHLHWLKGHEPAIPDVDAHPDDHGEENEVARFRIARAPPCAMPDEFKVAPPEEEEEESSDPATTTTRPDDERNERSSAAEGEQEDAAATSLLKGKEKEKRETIKAEEDDRASGGGGEDDEAGRIIAEAELAKRETEEEDEEEEEEVEKEEEEVKTTKVEVELQTTDGCVASIKTETSEETITSTTTTTTTATSSAAAGEEEDRVEDLLRPIEDEVAGSEVAFPLHVYQSYRAYYLGQKLSLKMSTFKTRDVPHWAQERVLEIRRTAQPKPAPVKKEKKTTTTTTRTRRTTTTTTMTTAAKRKRGQAAKATEAGDEDNEDEAAGDEDYTESGRLTRSRSRTRGKATQAKQELDEGEKKKKKTKRTKKNNDDGGDGEGQGNEKQEEEKKRKTTDEPGSGKASVPPLRRSPRTSKARSPSTAEAALSKRRKVVKEIK